MKKHVREYIDKEFKDTYDAKFRDWIVKTFTQELTENYIGTTEDVLKIMLLHKLYKDV